MVWRPFPAFTGNAHIGNRFPAESSQLLPPDRHEGGGGAAPPPPPPQGVGHFLLFYPSFFFFYDHIFSLSISLCLTKRFLLRVLSSCFTAECCLVFHMSTQQQQLHQGGGVSPASAAAAAAPSVNPGDPNVKHNTTCDL